MVGFGNSRIAATFSGNGRMPSFVSECPRNDNCDLPNSHLAKLIAKLFSRSRWKIVRKCCRCSSSDDDAIHKSSIYGKTKSNPRKTSCINRWNVWAALQRPKVINMNSKSPNGVVMAVLAMSSGWIGTWWNAFCRTIFENTIFSCKLFLKSVRYGNGYRSGTVIAFNAR